MIDNKQQDLDNALLTIVADFKVGEVGWKQTLKEIKQAVAYHSESPSGADFSVLVEQLELVQKKIGEVAQLETNEFNKTVHHQHIGTIHNAIEVIKSYGHYLPQFQPQDRNLKIKLSASIERHLKKVGALDMLLKGAKHYEEYEKMQKKIFSTVSDIIKDISQPSSLPGETPIDTEPEGIDGMGSDPL